MFPENKEEGFLYEDDADFEEEFDVNRDLYLNTIDSMIRDSVDNREEVKFEDFAARAGLLMGAHRLKNNARFLLSLDQVKMFQAQFDKPGNAMQCYTVRETIQKDWIVENGITVATDVVGYLVGAIHLDVDKTYYVEFSA